MARCRQSLKRCRTDAVRAARNRSRIRTLRTAFRRVSETDDPEEREKRVRTAQSMLDRAARRNLIHPNKARRLKSSLMS